MRLQFAGIRRSSNYSPNHFTNDGLILLKTAQELMKLGANFKIYDETEIDTAKISEDFIFSMAQGKRALKKLIELEAEGKFIINSPRSSLSCYRANMAMQLINAGIKFPASKIVKTDSFGYHKIADVGKEMIWLKRGDVHAVHREDVSLVYSDEELNIVLKEFAHRGIEEAVLQEHICGDVIKFYSVRDTEFFYWYYLDKKNDYHFDLEQLKKLALHSANILGLLIYGGDAVVSEGGVITIIDINDWPSFAPIKNEASKYIAESIYTEAMRFCEPANKMEVKL
jgi:glutathione synthase/RimK-type ligase-like ATP-grasp enzyme